MPPCSLTVTVIEAALGALLVTTIGGAVLATLRLTAAEKAAIALSAIAVAAYPEHRTAFGVETHPLPKNDLLAAQRHPLCRWGFDNSADSWQLQFECLAAFLHEGCRATGTPPLTTAGLSSRFHANIQPDGIRNG